MNFLQQLSLDLKAVGQPDWKITSYIRSNGSHSTGKAVDLILPGKPISVYPEVFYNIASLKNKYYIALSYPWNVHFHITALDRGLGMELHRPGRNPHYTKIQDIRKRFLKKQYYIVLNNKEYNL